MEDVSKAVGVVWGITEERCFFGCSVLLHVKDMQTTEHQSLTLLFPGFH
jgi:hypothetical protein